MVLSELIDTLLRSCQLEGDFMFIFDTKMKALDTEIFPQHTIADLGITFIILVSQEKSLKFNVKGNKHTHTHTHTPHTRARAHTHTHTSIKKRDDLISQTGFC